MQPKSKTRSDTGVNSIRCLQSVVFKAAKASNRPHCFASHIDTLRFLAGNFVSNSSNQRSAGKQAPLLHLPSYIFVPAISRPKSNTSSVSHHSVVPTEGVERLGPCTPALLLSVFLATCPSRNPRLALPVRPLQRKSPRGQSLGLWFPARTATSRQRAPSKNDHAPRLIVVFSEITPLLIFGRWSVQAVFIASRQNHCCG